MKVVLSCEFAGFTLKNNVLNHLTECGHEVIDVGQTSDTEKVLYPQAAAAAAQAILDGKAEKGIVICGSGAGMSIVANKFKGIYCVSCESTFTANMCAFINGANLLAMGYNVVGPGHAFAMVDAFLSNSFAKDADKDRTAMLTSMLNDVKSIEDKNFK